VIAVIFEAEPHSNRCDRHLNTGAYNLNYEEGVIRYVLLGSPGRNRNRAEKSGNLRDFCFRTGIDTPKNRGCYRTLSDLRQKFFTYVPM
jgi:hypothetical protein